MPPEFPVCTQKLDIYTFGLNLNEIFGGNHELNEQETIVMTKIVDFFSETIIQCTSTDSSNRPDAKKLKSDFLVFQKLMFFLLTLTSENYWRIEWKEKDASFKKSYDLIMQTIKR